EVEQRRSEMKQLREAEEADAVKLAAAGREAEDALAVEGDSRARWAELTAPYPALSDPANLGRARQALAQAVTDTITRATETRGRLDALRTRLHSAEETHDVENEAYGMARAHGEQADQNVLEAQRLLNQARNALRAAGLEDVEARITLLQRQLKTAEERARQCGVAKGIALHRLEAARQTHTQQLQASAYAEKQLV